MKPQRLDLDYDVVWQGRWHVGSGYQSMVADRLARRWHDETPFVPGSQVKGVLRHQCERLALALGLEAVDPHAGGEAHNQRLVEHFRPLAASDLVVDRLFGSRYQGECLFATNAEPVSSAAKRSIQARTAMDRLTRTVLDGHLFTTETTEGENLRMQGSIRARHPAGVMTQDEDGFPFEYSLLVASLLSLDALGGDKSVGLGRCEVAIRSLRWNGRDTSLADALQGFEENDWGDLLVMVRDDAQGAAS